VRWRAVLFPEIGGGTSGDVVAANGSACISDEIGGSGCVDVATGDTLWTARSDSSWSRQDAIDDSLFFYGTRNHRVIARRVANGSVKWATDVAPGAQYLTLVSGVSLHGDVLFVTTQRWLVENGFRSTGDLIALDRATGKELWRFSDPDESSEFFGAPVFFENLAIFSDVDRHSLRAVDVGTREQVWETEVSADGFVTAERPPAISGDTVFVASTDARVHAFDARTGVLLWRVPAGGGSLGSTAACGRLVLVIPWVSGALIAVDRQNVSASRPRVLIDGDELFSRIVTDGANAYAAGLKGTYAFRCAT